MAVLSCGYFVLSVSFIAWATGLYVGTMNCPDNEEYHICGTACPFNCSDPQGSMNCTGDCVNGCFCKPGYLRSENGTCVTEDQCLDDNLCGPNEEFLLCGTACAQTCAQSLPEVCNQVCSVGCFCRSGYVRESFSGKCVTLDKCSADLCLNENEVYDICNGNCEPSCTEPDPICSRQCTGGCICAPGYLRSASGGCVVPDQCVNNTDYRYLKLFSQLLKA